jgi:hypothetical protein
MTENINDYLRVKGKVNWTEMTKFRLIKLIKRGFENIEQLATRLDFARVEIDDTKVFLYYI